MGLFPLVARPALRDLFGFAAQPTPEQEAMVGQYFGIITAAFLIGAATGGVVFGWLGDKIGRVRSLTLSVLVYALFTGLCGLAGAPWQIGVLRFIAATGMGGEWSLGVALVMEVWPNRSRALMAGLIGAAANVGYFGVGLLGLFLTSFLGSVELRLADVGLGPETVAALVDYQGWRLMMLLGATPAVLTFLIRLFVPESARWKESRGTSSHWSAQDLAAVVIGLLGPVFIVIVWAVPFLDLSDYYLGPEGGRIIVDFSGGPIGWATRLSVTAVGLAIVTWGFVYPAAAFLKRLRDSSPDRPPVRPVIARMFLAACLSGVALLGTWGSVQWAPVWADQLAQSAKHAKEYAQMTAALGAIVGTVAAAFLGDRFGRRRAYCLLCLLSMISVWILFQGNTSYGPWFLASTFLAGLCTASFYGWLPLYLPELFRTNVRATGQGFGFNFGRILAAIGTLQVASLMTEIKEGVNIAGIHFAGGYPLACSSMGLVYLVGMLLIWLAPETKGRPLPD